MINDLHKLKPGDLVILYANGALEPDEVAYVEAELKKYPELMAKVDELREFNSQLIDTLGAPVTESKEQESVESENAVQSAKAPMPLKTDKRPKVAARKNWWQKFLTYQMLGNVAVLAGLVLLGVTLFPFFTLKQISYQQGSKTLPPIEQVAPSVASRQGSQTDQVAKDESFPKVVTTNTGHEVWRQDEQIDDGLKKEFENLFNAFGKENQEKLDRIKKELFDLLEKPETVKAEGFIKILDELSKLELSGDQDKENLQKLKDFIQKEAPKKLPSANQ